MTQRVALLTAWAPARTNNSDSWPQMFMTIGAMTGHIGQSGRMTGVSCWEYTANGGPFLVSSGGSGVPRVQADTINVKINNNELWHAVLNGKYTAGFEDVKPINIQMIVHDGGSALNQKVGMTEGIAAHRKVEFVVSSNYNLNTNSKYSDLVLPVTTQWERAGYIKGNREHLIWARQIVAAAVRSEGRRLDCSRTRQPAGFGSGRSLRRCRLNSRFSINWRARRSSATTA